MTSPVALFAAGSLKAAVGQVSCDFEQATGNKVDAVFGPSGLLRERIEAGEPADIFASADMGHPRALEAAGRAGPVRPFARNALCALARPGLDVTTADLLDTMLDPAVRLGTSTPKADPSGDYAFQLFARADALIPGAEDVLTGKALQLTGGPGVEPPPGGRNAYAWVLETGRADLLLTYRTNAMLARKEVPDLQIVNLPKALSVGADYGIAVLKGAPTAAQELADRILGPAGQQIMATFGFDALKYPTPPG